ncbi:MAG TPA: dihydrofolate reductase [Steroidobacteraceae bacterium]|nr:dihydrofolate reductase [Steroidobacteraceae bacterium]
MKLTAVVAASDNDVIGRDNAMPWHLPADLAYFRRVTMGKPMLMGRKTYESIGRPLPGRRSLVLSRGGFSAPGVEGVATIEEACERVAGAHELMVIGGAEVFRLAMKYLDHIHLTRVHTRVEGDVLLPQLAPGEWREVRREDHPADERNAFAMTFIEMERIRR